MFLSKSIEIEAILERNNFIIELKWKVNKVKVNASGLELDLSENIE